MLGEQIQNEEDKAKLFNAQNEQEEAIKKEVRAGACVREIRIKAVA